MDFEREERRHRFRSCRAGFALVSLGIGLLCVDAALWLVCYLTRQRELLELVQSPAWEWIVGAPITWATLLGSYLLLGRFPGPAWQSRAGLLVLMNSADLVLWALSHNESLGLKLGDVGHEWFRLNLARGLGWAEFLLFAALAGELLGHLEKPEAAEAGLAARSLSILGLTFWLITFLAQTDWSKGWPLVRGPFGPGSLLSAMGYCLLTALTAFQITVLGITACRSCAQILAQMDREDSGSDLLRSRSELDESLSGRWFQDDDPFGR